MVGPCLTDGLLGPGPDGVVAAVFDTSDGVLGDADSLCDAPQGFPGLGEFCQHSAGFCGVPLTLCGVVVRTYNSCAELLVMERA